MSEKTFQILCIIPCLNEEKSVASVVAKILALGKNYIPLVVDDGSGDSTAKAAEEAGARVLRLPVNLGIGATVQTGYRYAEACGFDIAVQVDGDGQHPVEVLPALVELLQNDQADLVIGSRYFEGSSFERRVSSFSRVVGTELLSVWMRFLTGKEVADPTSGFRAANRKVIAFFAEHYFIDYPEPISVFQLLRIGYRVKEVSVQMSRRAEGRSSIRHIYTVQYMLKACFRMFLYRLYR